MDDKFWDPYGSQTAGRVPVNIRETEHNYEMDVIVPGCKKEDFDINIADNMLTISFEHKSENREENGKPAWVRNEYMLRSFSRSFTLDDTVDVNQINGNYKNAILRLTLPKNEKAKKLSRKIEVK